MNKEKVLQLVSELLDKEDLFVQIIVPHYKQLGTGNYHTAGEAESFVKSLHEAMGGGNISDERGSLNFKNDDIHVCFCYKRYMEEDVLLGGDTDGTPLGTSDDRAC